MYGKRVTWGMVKTKSKESLFLIFLKNFFLLFAFRGVGILTTATVNIIAGRNLSVEMWGQFNTIFSLSNFLVIPLIMGVNNSLLKILPESSPEKREEITGTVVIGNIALCLLFSIIGFLLTPAACMLFRNITPTSWHLAICFAVATNACIVTETFLKINEKFSRLGIARMTGGIVLLTSTIIFISFSENFSSNIFVMLNIMSQFLIFLISVFRRKRVKIAFHWSAVRAIFKVSAMYMLSWRLGTGLNYADVFIISALRNSYEIGIFNGYQVNVRGYFSAFYYDIFAAVLLPTLINHGGDLKKLVKTVIKFLPVVFAVLSGGTIVVILGLLFAYGSKYPVVWSYILLEAAGIAFQGIYYFFSSLLVTEGQEGARASLEFMGKPFLLLIAIILFFTWNFGLLGTFISFTVNQGILAALMIFHYYRKNRRGESGVISQTDAG